ncbi:hypothetical protein AT6N2_C2658 [Agrobacterium tumefaciens]|nr:hypothetical protein AT6N2_C2658 [Agrobacterium tumefaciens]
MPQPHRFSSSIASGDRVEKCAGDTSSPAARWPERPALPIGNLGKWLITTGIGDAGVMKFVAAQHNTSRTKRPICRNSRLPVAKVHLARGKAGGMRQKPGHRVVDAVGILQRLAEHHVTAALAMNRLCRSKSGDPRLETSGIGELAGMKLGITARQPADITAGVGRLVRKRRKRNDLCTCRAPMRFNVRIEKGERCILGQGNALAGRSDGHLSRAGRNIHRCRKGQQNVEIDGLLHHIRQPFDVGFNFRMFAGLYQPQMSFRKDERRVSQHTSGDGKADLFDSLRAQRPVSFAARPVQHNGGHGHRRIVVGKAMSNGGRRLRLAGHIQHQKHGNAEEPRQIRRRSGAIFRSRDAVEQAHGAFNENKLRIPCLFGKQIAQQVRLHGPAIEIKARCACRKSVEPRIDVIRAGLDAAHLDAASGKSAKQADRHACLA